MPRTDIDWPLPPEVEDPAPPRQRRSWGKLSHSQRYRQQRSALLRAAAKLGGRDGYEGTRVADIVAEAELSKSTFYEHFASKEDCFVELYRRTSANMLRAAVEEAEATLAQGPYRCLQAVIRSLVRFPERDRRLATTFRTELGVSEPAIRAQGEENLRRIIAFFVALAARLGTELEDAELELAASILVRGVTDVLGDLRRHAETLEERLDAIAALGCRAFALPTSGS